MSQNYAVQLCRLVAPEKLTDRFLVSGILTHHEGTFLGDQVVLFYILEVTKPWFPSSRVLPTIIETLLKGHARLTPESTKLEDQFEQLLRSVNEQLNIISEQGETDWIGNLNGLIMVAHADEIHFSQTGYSPAYLLQNNRIRQITDDNATEREPHPLKTFSNLASGKITENDQILVANHELYQVISLDALRRIIHSSSPFASCQAVAKELKKEKSPGVSAIIFKAVSKNVAESSEEPFEVLLEDELQSNFKKLSKRLSPFKRMIQKAGSKTGKAALKAGKSAANFTTGVLIPKTSQALKSGLKAVDNLQKKAKSTPITQEDAVVEIIFSKNKLKRAEQERIVQEALERADEAYLPTNQRLEDLDSNNTEVNSEIEKPAINSRLQKVKSWLSQTKNQKVLAICVAFVLIVLTLVSIRHRQNTSSVSNTSNQNQTVLNQIEELENKISSAVKLSQEIEASREITEATAKFDLIKKPTSDQQKQYDQLWNTLVSQSDSLGKTTRLVKVDSTAKFSSPASGFITNQPYFYGYDPSVLGMLRTGNGENSQVQATIALTDATDSIISIAHSSESDTVAYALSKQNKVFRILQSNSQTILKAITPTSGSFATGDVIASYNGNVYILDHKTGLLWKYANGGTSYAKGVSIIDGTKYNIKDSISIAIDGAIFILKNDGNVQRYTRGVPDSFSLKKPSLFSTLVQPLQIITDDSMSSIYLLDGGLSSSAHSTAKILEFNKSGDFLRSFAFPDKFTNVRWFDISPKDNKIWILNNDSVSQFSY